MKYMTFPAAGKLTGVAAMLECLGHETNDRAIALGMNAPWLFVKKGERYLAGSTLYQPRWLDLYLIPFGFHMTEIALPKENVPAYLRTCKTAMLPMTITKNIKHPVVFTGYADGRYGFTNIKRENFDEPDTFSLTTAMLKRRLADQVTVHSLKECAASKVDFIPLLFESLDHLASYQADVLEALKQTVTREELCILSERIFHALMRDLLPMAELANDAELAYELCLLNHDYRHVFTRNSPTTVTLDEKLPRSSICQCITWLREDIIDRLYAHGVSDQEVEAYLHRFPSK